MSVNGFKVNNVVERYNYASLDNLPDLEGAIAGAYSSTSTYNVGDYVWHNGSLYRCNTAITTVEAWTAAHWTAAVLGNDVSGLKSVIDAVNPNVNIDWTLGKNVSGNGAIFSNQYTALSQKIQCSPGDIVKRTGTTIDSNGKFLVYYVSEFSGDTFIKRTEFTSSVHAVVIGDETTHVYISFGRYGSSGITITQSDIDTYFDIDFYQKAAREVALTAYIKNGSVYAGNDVDDISENSFWFVQEGTEHLPTSTGGYFVETIIYGENTLAAFQNAYKFDRGIRYYRRKVNGAWISWLLSDAPSAPTFPLYYAFGDSLTYGAVWTSKETSPYYQINQAAIENQIPTRIANAIGAANSFSNKGVGGAYFVGSGTNKIITAIQNQDLSNAKIITIAGGRNDSENPLGDKNSTAGDGTICGAIKEIIEYLQANYPKLQIVWIGVTPNTSDNHTVFTRVFAGGWSLNSYDSAVSELCAGYGIPYVDWKLCTYIRHWADFSGAGGVYSHPDNEESYLQMGNYIAGQVAQYYRG